MGKGKGGIWERGDCLPERERRRVVDARCETRFAHTVVV
jgi:hypothetical protein